MSYHDEATKAELLLMDHDKLTLEQVRAMSPQDVNDRLWEIVPADTRPPIRELPPGAPFILMSDVPPEAFR